MGRVYTRVHRLLRMICLLQSRRNLRARDLAKICETTERTIFRDIRMLQASEVPCHFDEEDGGYHITAGFFMPPVELTFDESVSLLALGEHVRDDQIAFMSLAARALEKIRGQLPRAIAEAIEPLDRHVTIDLARGMIDDSAKDVYERVRRAIATRRILRCGYEPVSSTDGQAHEAFELRPYALWYCQRAWYVVGHHSGRDDIRRLKLNRFIDCKLTDKPFRLPDEFDLHDHLGLAWRMIRGDKRYDIAVRFDAAFAETVCDTRWHSTQKEIAHDDGSVTLEFTVDGLDEIVWWLLGYGPNCRVIRPRELATRVRDLAKATAGRYARP